MSMTQENQGVSSAAMHRFETTTSRWGRLTMIAGLIVSLAGPLYLVFFGNLGIEATQLWTAFAAVAGTFFIIWLVEPVTYFPILGPAAMYQAFMIGNISNKLLPSALVAQENIGAKPGTPRGSLAASMAICGAAAVHLLSLLVFVGLLGTWLLSIMPESAMGVVRTYVVPAVFGAVAVQSIISVRRLRPTVIALVVAVLVQLVLVPAFPQLAFVATGVCVIATIILAWFLRARPQQNDAAA
jgi:hypothetical protein